MRALIMNPQTRRRIEKVVRHAFQNPHTLERQRANQVPGDDPNHVVCVPLGWRCVFSVDEDPDGDFWRHLSVSVEGAGKWPNPHGVDMLLAAFEFHAESTSDPHLMHWADRPGEAWNLAEPLQT